MPGLPYILNQSAPVGSRHNASSNSSVSAAVRFGPVKFGPLPNGEFTYSETLRKIKWHKIFPKEIVITKNIRNEIYPKFFWLDLITNIIVSIIATLFLIPFVSSIIRSIYYVEDKELRDQVHVSEHVLGFANAFGYFFFVAAITITYSVQNIIKLISNRLNYNKVFAATMVEYKTKRKSIIKTRNYIMIFFAISEMIYTLSQNISAENSSVIKQNLHRLLIRSGFDIENFLKGLGDRGYENISNLDNNTLIGLLYVFINTNDQLQSVVNKLKKAIKADIINPLYLILFILINPNMVNVINIYKLIFFCNKVDRDPNIINIIVYLIGETSCDRTNPNASILLNPINMFEDGIDKVLEKAISSYWNDKNTEELVHPHGVASKKLATTVNLKLIAIFNFLLLYETSSGLYAAHRGGVARPILPLMSGYSGAHGVGRTNPAFSPRSVISRGLDTTGHQDHTAVYMPYVPTPLSPTV